jgi:hypothetical protein
MLDLVGKNQGVEAVCVNWEVGGVDRGLVVHDFVEILITRSSKN